MTQVCLLASRVAERDDPHLPCFEKSDEIDHLGFSWIFPLDDEEGPEKDLVP